MAEAGNRARDAALAVRAARASDIDGIVELLDANGSERGGMLHGSFPRERIAAWLEQPMPVVVAYRGGDLAGVLLTSCPEWSGRVPVIAAMLAAHPARGGAYVYGPVCVAAAARGQGVLPALYAEVRRRLPGREAILFIREDNAASLKAHERLGLRRAGAFRHEGVEFAVFGGQSNPRKSGFTFPFGIAAT